MGGDPRKPDVREHSVPGLDSEKQGRASAAGAAPTGADGSQGGRRKLGLIVNPVAGVGGRVGLKGSDGTDILRRALEMGAHRESPHRAALALRRLEHLRDSIEVFTYPGEMGEQAARACHFAPTVLRALHERGTVEIAGEAVPATTADDTEEAARRMAQAGVELVLFAGGDGTARNIFNAIGERVPVVGIPAGVKIHSAVYANTPADAGDLAALFVGGSRRVRLREAEVMDIDEEAFRDDRLSARLYGYLRIPYERQLVQSAKAGSQPSDEAAMAGIANEVINGMELGVLYVIGAGTTTRAIMRLLELPNTLLGVDAVLDRRLAGADLSEADLLRLVDGPPARIVISVIGGQGHIFGRGNQQISPAVIRAVGTRNVIVIATQAKLLALQGEPLHVDTGDEELDRVLAGWTKVVTGHGVRTMYRIA
jgi:predicted polyphosphate/ATP-dependent NAD kinase